MACCILLEPAVAATLHRYVVRVDPQLQSLEVRACFDGIAPSRLAASRAAARYLADPPRIAGGVGGQLYRVADELRLEGLPDDTCIDYVTEIENSAASSRYGTVRGATITNAADWFWRPRDMPRDADIEIAFLTAPGHDVSAPWTALSEHVYRVGRSPQRWPARVAFGLFHAQKLEVPGASLRLAVLDGGRADHESVTRWIREAAFAITMAYGRFPLPGAQILVLPVDGARGPVPWAQVLRGGGASAHFFIDAEATEAELRADWTATHELSHMLLPYIDRRDAWLSEGFASYYQNVLRARSGMLTPLEAWRLLDAGFRRGIDGTSPARTLSEASIDMDRTRGFMRVYWSGAAIALLADLRLRESTGGRQSLDTALAGLRRCCLPSAGRWRARALFDRLDDLTGTEIFGELHATHVNARAFPDLRGAYEALGLEAGANGLRTVAGARHAAVRDAIMRAPQASAAAD
ncbi:MAG TPA: hypothetical protein VM616_11470 [Gammaproteobacteria bacterium]|nr:hypothetical protein [Gammaproteobacteria bacterium]